MTSKTYLCPSCQNPLTKQIAPANSAKNPTPYVILYCATGPRCPSAEAANNGGSGPTEEAAYQNLLLSVKHEEDKLEPEWEPLSPEDLHDRNEWAKAEHANDMAKSGGA